MKKSFRDSFEIPQLLSTDDPLRAIPAIDSIIAEEIGFSGIESYAETDQHWVEFWSYGKALKTFPTRYHYKGNEIWITPLTETWFKVEVKFDLDGVIWTKSYQTEDRPNMPKIKKKFESKFTEVGLEWPKWIWF